MTKLHWSLIADCADFDLGNSGARIGLWRESEALCFEGSHCFPVLLREPLSSDSFIVQAEVACTPESFVGLAFGVIDSDNYELVYVSADNEWDLPNLQYDPIMNGSSTWQIYHGPRYQALASIPSGEWVKFTIKVQPHCVSVYIGEGSEPNLVISSLMLESASDMRIGVWGSSASYLRNLSVEQIESAPSIQLTSRSNQLVDESLITE
jgi:hypothetical protein